VRALLLLKIAAYFLLMHWLEYPPSIGVRGKADLPVNRRWLAVLQFDIM
jgi:hypothetical protein